MARDDDDGAHLVFVYGTLKRGFPNHGLVADLAASGDAGLVSGAARTAAPPHPALVIGPWAVPFLLPLPGAPTTAPVSGELLSLSPRAVALLDRFEGVHLSLYERRPISIAIAGASSSSEAVVVEAEAYYAHRSYAAEMWRRCGERGIEGGEYTTEAARAYVTHADRPADSSLLLEVRRFLASPD